MFQNVAAFVSCQITAPLLHKQFQSFRMTLTVTILAFFLAEPKSSLSKKNPNSFYAKNIFHGNIEPLEQ